MSVDRAGRDLVGELDDGVHDPTPCGRAVVVAGGRELISSSDSFLERRVAVAFDHELRPRQMSPPAGLAILALASIPRLNSG